MKNFLNVISWFKPFWLNAKKTLIIILIGTVFSVLVKSCYPLVMKYVIDHLENPETVDSSRAWIFLLFLTGLLMQLCQWWLPVIRGKLNLDLSVAIRMRLFRKILSKHPDFFSLYRNGDLVTRLTDDVDSDEKLQWYSCSGIMRPIEAICVIVFSLCIMVSLNPWLTLYSVAPLPFVWLLMVSTQKIQSRYFSKRQKTISSTFNVLETAFNGLRIVISTVSEKAQGLIFRDIIKHRNKAEKDVITTRSLLEAIGAFLNQGGVIIVLFAGGHMLINGKITLGDFVAFISYFSTLTMPLWTLSWFFVSTNQVNSSIQRHQTIEAYPELSLGQEITEEKSNLQFNQVAYSWNEEEATLQNISFNLKAGQTLALVGKVGSGKSTLLDLASGCLLPQRGEVKCDEVILSDLHNQERSKHIGYVPQECHLFTGTVYENIQLGRTDISDEAIQKALWTSCIDNELPLERQLSQGGVGLSGGQKARVALARALADEPNYLILDDITAALDSKTEQLFWQRVRESYPDAGILISTHRESTAVHADEILWLHNASIYKRSKHQELLKNEEYNELFAKSLAYAG